MKMRVIAGLAAGALLVYGGVNIVHATPSQLNLATWAGNGHEYILYADNAISWQDAKQWVTLNLPGYHLATVTSAGEDDFINTSLFANFDREYWMGGLQDPFNSPESGANWKWDNGEAWSYTNWSPGEPNDFYGHGSEQYLGANWGSRWNDEGYLGNIGGFAVEKSEPNPIPEPATMLLFGLGLSGLAGLIRIKRH